MPTAGQKTVDKAVGRTRGGLNKKLRAIVDGLGNPVTFLLSSGNDHDPTHAIRLQEQVHIRESRVLADRAYGAAAIRDYILEQGASYVIPLKINTPDPWSVDWHLYISSVQSATEHLYVPHHTLLGIDDLMTSGYLSSGLLKIPLNQGL